jgi:hypothetical protein
MKMRVKEKYLISWLELLRLGSIPQVRQSEFSSFSGRLEVHVPLFDGLESSVFNFYGKVQVFQYTS